MKFDDNIKMAVIAFVVICFAIYYMKPSFMFHNDNSFKQFGLTKNKTIYPFWLVCIIMGLIVYLLIILKYNDYI